MKLLKILAVAAFGALTLVGCDDDYLYPVEYPTYDPNAGDPGLPKPENDGPRVVAHRGGATEAGAQAPDNSIASLNYAIRLGCYASECDIYWTKDNEVVVAHATSGHFINGLEPWKHTLAELRDAAKLDNGETVPSLGEFLDVVLRAGTTKLWLDVKRIDYDGTTTNTDESVKACERACEIIAEKKAQNFCEFIVSGNTTIWAGSYAAALKTGIACGWMSYRSASSYTSYMNPWANLDYTNFFANGVEVASPTYSLQSYIDAGVALSIYNADSDAEMAFILPYHSKMKAICTNYPAKLIAKIKAMN